MNNAIANILKHDSVIAQLAGKLEVKPLPVTNDIYLDMLENIVSQQLSGRVATTIFNRFLDLFPDRYPNPNHLLKLDDIELRKVGLSGAKSTYVKAMAEFAMNHDLNVDTIQQLPDDEVIKLLTQVKGVGVWTAQMLLIFSLGRNDVFPVDDLAIRQGMVELYHLKSDGKKLRHQLLQISERWAPYRTWGTRLIWAYVNSKKQNATRV
ncbi:DNA-3-methyladenine glycosylase family protein [Tenuifilum sp.]|uniref:DNA-3-methyladenine glycosylase family protein n=1 Tax=Tenuifilum sp. TaxID=2760880 RepID=UPI001B60A83D|nr:DNA-3-methyladenine glycosylase 2 family protein [Bacteroidales bacterium]HOK61743.1 hypothetical protein [Tenuifilum sp.]HOK86404.1 hypothetical protein [Tenuifilum sp.]HON71659.1 hypothetical protein [Tenuifilum sp.]HOU75456.1 hypothetical protein [Tenuifilum sp.]